jgi:hypothetical protein
MTKINKLLNWVKCLIIICTISIIAGMVIGHKLGVESVCTQLEYYKTPKETVLPCFKQDKEIITNEE